MQGKESELIGYQFFVSLRTNRRAFASLASNNQTKSGVAARPLAVQIWQWSMLYLFFTFRSFENVKTLIYCAKFEVTQSVLSSL